MYRYKHARVHTRVQTQTTHVFLVALITKRSYVRPVTVSAIREANSTWSLNLSVKNWCVLPAQALSWGQSTLEETRKKNKWFTDKASSLGTKSFCFLSSRPRERSVSQRAQSVPQTMLDTRQTGDQPGFSYNAEFPLAAHGRTQKASPGYHSLPGKDQSCYFSSLSE